MALAKSGSDDVKMSRKMAKVHVADAVAHAFLFKKV